MTTNQNTATDLLLALGPANETDWLASLKVFLATGVADHRQIRTATGFTRDKVDWWLKRFAEVSGNRPAILRPYDHPLPLVGSTGRAPKVYVLGEGGAALLRAKGYPHTRACGLNDDTAISHALRMLDLHLRATTDGLSIQTDVELPYGDGRRLRPDHLVTLPDGQRVIVEIEQAATPDTLRRVLTSLDHKLDFFRHPPHHVPSNVVRVLFNLKRGRTWDTTLDVWRQAIEIKRRQLNAPLPFRLCARSLKDFLDQPDWSGTVDETRWIDLTALPIKPTHTSPARSAITAPAPAALIQYASRHDERLVLSALHQWYLTLAHALRSDRPQPDPEFLHLVRLIYSASHDPTSAPLDRAAVPHASLFLLHQWLDLHPKLKKTLEQTLLHSAYAMRWNPTTILHRLQVTVDAFLAYFGWSSQGALKAWAEASDYTRAEHRAFKILVRIESGELLMLEPDGVVPNRDEVRYAEKALAWVLSALFAHAPDLGLKRPPFW